MQNMQPDINETRSVFMNCSLTVECIRKRI